MPFCTDVALLHHGVLWISATQCNSLKSEHRIYTDSSTGRGVLEFGDRARIKA